MPTTDYRVETPPEIRALLTDIGGLVGSALPPGWGFGLFIFTYGSGGTMTWISSAERQDMLAALQEFLKAQAS